MKIYSLTAKNVYGKLNFKVRFNENLTFLIGINGSGKTTALLLMQGLITPSYDILNKIKFEKVKLICSTSTTIKKDIIIEAKIIGINRMQISLQKKGKLLKRQTFFRITPEIYEDDLLSDDLKEKISLFRQKFNDLEVVKLIKELDTPVFLGIDRRIGDSKYRLTHRIRLVRRRNIFPVLETSLNNSLSEVQELVYNFIRQIPERQSIIIEDFKNRIFSSSFEFKEKPETKIPSARDIRTQEKQIHSAIEQLSVGDISKQIKTFFGKMLKLIQDINKGGRNDKKNLLVWGDTTLLIKWFANSPQLNRVSDIIDQSKKYQQEIIKLNEPLRKLENIVTKFMVESKKQLKIKEDGEMQIIDGEKDPTSIFELSSGEKQIVIMIAHLIFYEEQAGPSVFVIDEPELSLHLSWQEIFVESLMEASPRTQFILSTHSPSIISQYSNMKYNRDLSKSVLINSKNA